MTANATTSQVNSFITNSVEDVSVTVAKNDS